MAEKAPGGVQSVERVFELLELITDAGGDVTLSELSSSTDLPLPTIHRLLRTLVTLGYIRQLPNRRYALGPRLIRLGEGANKQLGAAGPAAAQVPRGPAGGDRPTWPCWIRTWSSTWPRCPSLHSMRMFTEVGRRAHTHATGVGKAILAQLDDEMVRGIVSPQPACRHPRQEHRRHRFPAGGPEADPRTRLLHRRGGAGDRRPLLRHGRAQRAHSRGHFRLRARCPAWTSPSPTAPCRCCAKRPRFGRAQPQLNPRCPGQQPGRGTAVGQSRTRASTLLWVLACMTGLPGAGRR